MSQNNKPAAHTPANGSDTWHGLKEHLNDVAQKARYYGCDLFLMNDHENKLLDLKDSGNT
ncbi:MAG: hypothetical protein ACKO4S_00165 [Snowella sp.]